MPKRTGEEEHDVWKSRRRWKIPPRVYSAAVGIDLGTSNSCVSVWDSKNHCTTVLRCEGDAEEEDGYETFPSVVSYAFDRQQRKPIVTEVGRKATKIEDRISENNTETNERVVRNVKRIVGVDLTNSEARLKYLSEIVACDVVRAKTTEIIRSGADLKLFPRRAPNQRTSPEEVSSVILQRLKDIAEKRLHHPVTHAVVAVPAYFNHTQRICTHVAAKMAGFQEIVLMSEPIAAAMAYGLFVAGRKCVLVFDLGGGTLDVSVLEIDEGRFRVLATNGDSGLGGTDIDHAIARALLVKESPGEEEKEKGECANAAAVVETRVASKTREDCSDDIDVSFLRRCERAKCALSDSETYTSTDDSDRAPLSLTRKKLERVCAHIFDRCESIASECMSMAQIKSVDEVVLVGGSTRIPELRRRLREKFSRGRELCHSADATAVAEGASIQAAVLAGADSKETLRDVMMLDVLPLSLGVKCASSGKLNVVIPRNSGVPCSKSRVFRTSEDDQAGVTVEVYEGDDENVAEKNLFVGSFDFFIPKARRGPAGEVEVVVTFEINSSGVVRVYTGDSLSVASTEEDGVGSFKLLLLALYVAALFALYIAMKITFHDPIASHAANTPYVYFPEDDPRTMGSSASEL